MTKGLRKWAANILALLALHYKISGNFPIFNDSTIESISVFWGIVNKLTIPIQLAQTNLT